LLFEGCGCLGVIVRFAPVFDDPLKWGPVGDVPAVFVFEGDELGDEGNLG
jgi:hypothetical protein